MELFMMLTMATAAACFFGGILWLVGKDVERRMYLKQKREEHQEEQRMLKIRAQLVNTARRSV